MRHKTLIAAAVMAIGLPTTAHAFCGFYVGGADAELYNNATLVVMMRHGTLTVLSMQNNYQGPPADFAMVVPVPVVLQESNVKTLPKDVFQHVDRLSAPRLVEYWEQDPCRPGYRGYTFSGVATAESIEVTGAEESEDEDLGVTIEAEFEVGEYQIVILSAKDSGGLDTWLRRERYHIPEGAEPLLRPYVASGMKFFVAKVDTDKVTFENGQAMLSPLRFHYESVQFNLPVRLGLMNSSGAQDLLVHILAPGQRYELANYDNVTIPTNIEVKGDTRHQFAAFYAALFDATLEQHPNAVVTEYAWDAGSCDPCPTPALDWNELATLGADLMPGVLERGPSMVLTRLHARYSKDALGEDLVFRTAPPIMGGREMHGPDSQLERGARPGGVNNFQGRYIIRHPWTGPIECENPQRGIWGGPPGGGMPKVEPAKDVAFAPRGQVKLANFLAGEVAASDFHKTAADPDSDFKNSGIQPPPYGACAGCTVAQSVRGLAGTGFLFALIAGAAWLIRRRSRA